jgi:outer membrane lipoprotein LolB
MRLVGVVLASALWLAGCAQPPVHGAADAVRNLYSGRLALQVEGDASQSFSAGFELQGDARAGQLNLYTPLGGTAAALEWAPGSARLRQGTEVREFESLDALAARATGTAIPVAALFDWLRGTNTPVPGWEADLSQLAEGRLRARRSSPPPAADLRVALDR